jgi:PAS domain S-box-containing protein
MAIVIPAIACAIQWFLWPYFRPFSWLLFYPAVFFSSWIAGFYGGLLSTFISVACAIYFFIPPQLSFAIGEPRSIFSLGVFAAMGVLFSFFHERLERTRQKLEGTLESSIRDNEERYRTLFEQNPHGMVILDPETSRPIEFNDQACRQLGYDRKEFAGLTLGDIDIVEIPEEWPIRIRSIMQKGREDFDTLHRTKQGRIRDIHVTAQMLNVGGTPLLHCVWQDITEQKQGELELQESVEKFRNLVEQIGEVFYFVGIDGAIQYISPSIRTVLGFAPEELVGRNALEFIHPEDHEKVIHGVEDAMKGIDDLPSEFRMADKAGALHWVISFDRAVIRDGHPIGLQGICQDITERKQAEENLRASEQRFHALFETMSQGVIYQNVKGKIISANPAAERILGITLDQMQGKIPFNPRWHTIHPNGSRFSRKNHPGMIALQTRQPVQNVVMGVFHPQDGNYVWINVNAVPLFKPGATNPHLVHSTFEDISARKRNEDIMSFRLRLIEFSRTHSVKELLQQTLDEACVLVFSQIGFYHFMEPDQVTISLQAWSTRTRLEFGTMVTEDDHCSISEAGLWADCVRERRPLIHNDYATLANQRGLALEHAELKRELTVPVIRGSQIVAIMGLGNKPDDYNEIDLEIAATLADFSWDIIQQRRALDELLARKEEYRRLISVLPSGVVVHNQGEITLVNEAGLKCFGAANTEQLIGTRLMDRVHPDFREIVRERVHTAKEFGREAEPLEEQLLRLDGHAFDAEVSAISVNYQDRPSILAVFTDISERKQREREMESIASLSSALRTAPTRIEMLPVIVQQIGDLLNAQAAAIEIVEPHSGDTIVEAGLGAWADLIGSRQEAGTGINAIIGQTRQPFYTSDLENDPSPFFHAEARQGIRGCVGVPLIAQENRIGYIWVGRKTEIAESEIRLLRAISDIAANAIFRTTLHEQTERDAAALKLAYDTTLEGWARALELRDQETAGHTRRLVDTTLKLARLAGIGEDEMENIRRGALLHDIGKMGIPDSILLKPGTYTEREWEIMRRHPEYAHDMLYQIEYLRPALDIPYCHHEKWDGTGYPRGLKGEYIPLAARIFSVVDMWDALSHDRPYRRAWPETKVFEYIREQNGKHLDPKVVDIFINMMEQPAAS